MRVAYLTSQYPAPSHTFIRREVDTLRKRGVDVLTYSVRPPGEPDRLSPVDRQHHGQTFYILPAPLPRLLGSHLRTLLRSPLGYVKTLGRSLSHRPPGLRGLANSLFYFGETIDLAVRLRADGVEHLHNHFANPAANVGMLAAQLLGIPWSLTLHGISEFDYPAGLMLPDKLRAANFVACVSHFGRAQAMRIVEPTHWPKFLIARCGVETGSLPPRDGSTGGPPQILSVARLSPEKGLHGLLEAYANLVPKFDCQLVVLGSGPDHESLERHTRDLGIEGRVRFPGLVTEEEVLSAMARADLFVSSSFMEGLPVVLMEALAMRLGVVAPCVAGIPELIENEVTGLLFSPGDWDGLARQMRRLLDDPELRLRLAESGYRRVIEAYDSDRAVQPLWERFRDTGSSPVARDRRQAAVGS